MYNNAMDRRLTDISKKKKDIYVFENIPRSINDTRTGVIVIHKQSSGGVRVRGNHLYIISFTVILYLVRS